MTTQIQPRETRYKKEPYERVNINLSNEQREYLVVYTSRRGISLSEQRLVECIGRLDDALMKQIGTALMTSIHFNS